MRSVYGLIFLLLMFISCSAHSSEYCKKLGRFLSTKDVTCQSDYLISDISVGHSRVKLAVYSITPDTYKNNVVRRQYYSMEDASTSKMVHGEAMDYAHLASEKIFDIDMKSRFDAINRIGMYPSLNRKDGPWWYLEKFEHELSILRGEIVVLAGAVFKNSNGNIPSDFFKVFVDSQTNSVSAYWIPNHQKTKKVRNAEGLMQYVTSIWCVEERSGVTVLPTQSLENARYLKNGIAWSPFLWTQGEVAAHGQCPAVQKPQIGPN